MHWRGFLLWLVLWTVSFSTHSFAATFTDDMNNLEQNTIKSYAGLAPFLAGASAVQLAPFPDKTALTLPPGVSKGWAQYRVQGAETVMVGLYSKPGTFVSPSPYEPGSFVLGVYESGMQGLGGTVQAQFSPAGRAVYTRAAGRLQKLHTSVQGYVFADTQDKPDDLTGYGVNVYASADGNRFTRMPAAQTRLYTSPKLLYSYEEYSAALPANAQYVRVEINDVLQLPVYGSQKVVEKNAMSMTCLASVTFSGNSLVLGTPEPPAYSSSSLPAEPEESDAKRTVRPAADQKAPAAAPPPAVSNSAVPDASSANSAKFAGTIIRPGTEKAPRAPSVPDEPAKPAEEAPALPSETAQPVRVYEIARGTEHTDSRFTSGVIAYTVLVAGAIGVVIMLPRK